MGRVMTTLPGKVPSRGTLVPATGIVCAILGLAVAGCTHRIYHPHELSGDVLAPPTANVGETGVSELQNYALGSELIDYGDVLEVTVVTDYGNLNNTIMPQPVRVADDGTVDVRLIGKVAVAGLELESAESVIGSAGVNRGVFHNPHVTVIMKQRRMNQITVIGAVNEPNVYELPRGSSSLLAALVIAGSLTEDAGPDVEIRRMRKPPGVPGLLRPDSPRVATAGVTEAAAYEALGAEGPEVCRVSLVSAAKQGAKANLLADGDVVYVPKKIPKPVYVLGLVEKRGEIELPTNQDLHVLDVLSMAGGRTMQMADKVLVRRQLPGKEEPVVIQVSVRKAMREGGENLRLAPGDVVSVEETPVTAVLGTLQKFLRFGFSSALF